MLLTFEVLLTLAICTFVQGVFGVGILVFGTPILLALDYGYFDVLGILCPTSLGVSFFQIIKARQLFSLNLKIKIFSIFGVFTGSALLVIFAVPTSIYAIVAATMFFACLLRFKANFQAKVSKFLHSYSAVFYLTNSVFHGFSNMGGILLVLKNNLETRQQQQALSNTAVMYFIYVVCQIIVIVITGHSSTFFLGVLMSPIVVFLALIFLRIGMRILKQSLVNIALGVFFFSAGVVMSVKLISRILEG